MIKNALIIFCAMLVFTACNKENEENQDTRNCNKSEESFTGNNGLELTLSSQHWIVTKNFLNGIDASVIIKGSIVGDSASIRTFGDGLISDVKIPLNSNKAFDQEFGIYFTSTSVNMDSVSASTIIMVYQGRDTLTAYINSCF